MSTIHFSVDTLKIDSKFGEQGAVRSSHACANHKKRKRKDPEAVSVAGCKASYNQCHGFTAFSKSR